MERDRRGRACRQEAGEQPPKVVNYNAISQKLQVAVQKALLGDVTAQQAMTTAAADVEQILKQ